MNEREGAAWKTLLYLGATHMEIGGKHALNLEPIRATTGIKTAMLIEAAIEVVGRSGANRRHVNREGRPVYVVTDDDLGPLPMPRRQGRKTVWDSPAPGEEGRRYSGSLTARGRP